MSVMTAAALWPARSEPANSQSLRTAVLLAFLTEAIAPDHGQLIFELAIDNFQCFDGFVFMRECLFLLHDHLLMMCQGRPSTSPCNCSSVNSIRFCPSLGQLNPPSFKRRAASQILSTRIMSVTHG